MIVVNPCWALFCKIIADKDPGICVRPGVHPSDTQNTCSSAELGRSGGLEHEINHTSITGMGHRHHPRSHNSSNDSNHHSACEKKKTHERAKNIISSQQQGREQPKHETTRAATLSRDGTQQPPAPLFSLASVSGFEQGLARGFTRGCVKLGLQMSRSPKTMYKKPLAPIPYTPFSP